ncbi:hypothetical protein [Mycoplasmopsis bovirhinis]|uniref:Uncharacterized protein n=1 Tax=Mycoplasmopsis bovirhinis TaxID=29553 RepID=A0A449ADL7_9BACT|nr:hypothetical protein [Mycoplasmopsis bovirhinis]VEU63067.1 Uncharacterised protein [Mycoplasmopsis bovirhinis]
MHRIEMFRIYKPKRNLQDGIKKYAKRPCELLISLVDLKDEVIFGTICFDTTCQNLIRLFESKDYPDLKLHLDKFYKIAKTTLSKNINLYKYQKKVIEITEDKQVEVLKKLQGIFENRHSKFSLTYIYKKNQKPSLFF